MAAHSANRPTYVKTNGTVEITRRLPTASDGSADASVELQQLLKMLKASVKNPHKEINYYIGNRTMFRESQQATDACMWPWSVCRSLWLRDAIEICCGRRCWFAEGIRNQLPICSGCQWRRHTSLVVHWHCTIICRIQYFSFDVHAESLIFGFWVR